MVAPRGRQLQAARNDQLILEAARAVFVADPAAPIAAVAARASVGIAALYRRYASKEDLLRTLCASGLSVYIAETRAALETRGDAWAAFSAWMGRIVDADAHSLVQRLSGTFKPTEAMHADATLAEQLTLQIFDRTRAAGVLRPDVEVVDISVIFEMLAAVRLGDYERTRQLRHRYLALLLGGLRQLSARPLPGAAPNWDELRGRWRTAD